jgi:hypothetical protein
MISSKHFLQNVCWQGRTLLEMSNRSRHTEHSSRSFNIHSSMVIRNFKEEKPSAKLMITRSFFGSSPAQGLEKARERKLPR